MANGYDVHIQVVVDQVQLLAGSQWSGSPIDFACKVDVGRVHFVFPDHLKFRKNEFCHHTNFSAFVKEDHHTLSRGDHIAKSGPVISGHHWLWWNIGHVAHACHVVVKQAINC